MKTIFVSEFLCSGAWPEEVLPESLITEGRLMLEAICEDLLQSGEYNVCTTRDQRVPLSDIPGLEVIDVASPEQEWEMFQKLARHRDGTIVIAPELDSILFDRIDWLQQNGLNRLMSSSKAVRLCADKWLFYEFCLKHEIPTPNTYQYRDEFAEDFEFPLPFPFVIKPQLGAGTTMTAVIDCQESWTKFSSRRTIENDFPPYLLQPFLPGEPVSIACLISPDGKRIEWCPMAKQNFEGLEYQGGIAPLESEFAQQVRGVAEQAVKNLPGLRGYIGFDFLISPDSDKAVQILEINSRLTTSYLGYRAIAKETLAKRLAHSEINSPLQWSSKQVQFDTQGQLLVLHGRYS